MEKCDIQDDNITIEKLHKKRKQTRFKRIIKRTTKVMLILFIAFFTFVLLLGVSPTFRQGVVAFATNTANKFLLADIKIYDIKYSTNAGIIIENVLMQTDNDTLASVKKIIIDVNFKSFLTNKITINSIKLDDAKIKLIRSAKDSLWNFNKIVQQSNEEKDTTKKTGLKLIIKNIALNNSEFMFWDSIADWGDYAGSFKPTQMYWKHLNFTSTDNIIDLENMYFGMNILNLCGVESDSKMDIHHIKMNTSISKDGIYANNADISADEFDIKFNASITNFDVFGEPEDSKINNAVMSIKMTGNNFAPKFVDYFNYLPIRLGDAKKINIEAKGSLNEMNIAQIEMDIENSYIELNNVKLKYLTKPDKLTYTGNINSSYIKYTDIPNILQSLDLSAIPNFGYTNIKNIYFYGTTDSIYTDLEVKSGIGDVKGIASIGFRTKSQGFAVDVQGRNINLTNILKNNEDIKITSTDLNTNIKLYGRSLDIDKMTADLQMEILPSKIDNYIINNGVVECKYNGSDTLIIDRIGLKLANAYFINDTLVEFKKLGNIDINGGVGIKDLNRITSNVNIKLQNLNISKVFDNDALPTNLTGQINFSGNSINPDNMLGYLNVNFDEIEFTDKSIFPISIYAKILTDSTINLTEKTINLLISNFLDTMLAVNVLGDISIPLFISNLATSTKEITNIFQRDIESVLFNNNDTVDIVNNQFDDILSIQIDTLNKFYNSNVSMELNIKSINLLDIFVDSLKTDAADINATVQFISDSTNTKIIIDTLNINKLGLLYKNQNIEINELLLNTELDLYLDTTNNYQTSVSLNLHSNGSIIFETNKIDSFDISANFNDKSLTLAGQILYNEFISAKLNGFFILDSQYVEINMDTFAVEYAGEKWYNKYPITGNYRQRSFQIRQLELVRDNKEHIQILGMLNRDTLYNFKINLTNFDMADLNTLLIEKIGKNRLPIEAKMDSLVILANGTLYDPEIKVVSNLSKLKYEKQLIGNFYTNLSYSNEKVVGIANLLNNNIDSLFLLNINSFPIYIGIDSKKEVFKDTDSMNISLNLNNFPADIISPFVPSVDNIRGNLNGVLNVSGNIFENYNYSGELNFENLKMRIIPINMLYTTFGKINIETNKISFNNLKIKNQAEILRNGEANVSGEILLDGTNLKNIDITANTKQFQVLSDMTEMSMPWFYGKMIIATNDKPIHFYGTLDKPNLEGTITILNSDIKMPQVLYNSAIKREKKFTYIDKNTLRLEYVSRVDSVMLDSIKMSNNQNFDKSFVDLLNIDMSVIIRQFQISLDLGSIGQIYARVGTQTRNAPVHYVKHRDEQEAKLYGGELKILEGSSLQIYKTMSATGDISFPTARISRPSLSLTAEYQGQINTDNSGIVNYSVFANITGTPQNPTLDLSYSVNGTMATGDKQQIKTDAFMVLTSGILKGYNDRSGNDLLGQGQNIGSMLVSQVASQKLTDLLMKTGVIQSANLKFNDNNINMNSANVSISGSLGGVATWTLGGNIEDISSNYNFSVDIPIDINSEIVKNILLQLTKSTDHNAAITDRNAKNWEIRLRFGGNW